MKSMKLICVINAFLILNNSWASSERNLLTQPTLLDPKVPILEVLPTAKEKIQHAPYKPWFNLSLVNTAKYMVGGTLLSYGALFTYLLYASYKINDAYAWASWHQDLSLNQLQSQAQTTSHELILALGEKYATSLPTKPFLSDIEDELSTIRFYLMLTSWIAYFKLDALFPSQKALILNAQNKHDRLTYLHGLVSNIIETTKCAKRVQI